MNHSVPHTHVIKKKSAQCKQVGGRKLYHAIGYTYIHFNLIMCRFECVCVCVCVCVWVFARPPNNPSTRCSLWTELLSMSGCLFSPYQSHVAAGTHRGEEGDERQRKMRCWWKEECEETLITLVLLMKLRDNLFLLPGYTHTLTHMHVGPLSHREHGVVRHEGSKWDVKHWHTLYNTRMLIWLKGNISIYTRWFKKKTVTNIIMVHRHSHAETTLGCTVGLDCGDLTTHWSGRGEETRMTFFRTREMEDLADCVCVWVCVWLFVLQVRPLTIS